MKHVARIGERRDAYRVSVGKSERMIPPRRSGLTWEDNIKMNLQDVRWGGWTGLIWLRVGTGGGLL